jgi:hypothetical protein
MRIVFIVSLILISFCSFSQTWEYKYGYSQGSPISRIKKVSDGVYSLKIKQVFNGTQYVVSGDIKRFKKGDNGKEYCNFKLLGNVNTLQVNEKGKCLLIHEGDNILWFDWDEWEDKPQNNPSTIFKKIN